MNEIINKSSHRYDMTIWQIIHKWLINIRDVQYIQKEVVK